jgi:predicted nucleic acid-binding protein
LCRLITFFEKAPIGHFSDADPDKQKRARDLFGEHALSGAILVSTQAIQEFYVAAAIRKLRLPGPTVRVVTEALFELPVITVTPAHIRPAMDNELRYGISFWDGLILAAAEAGGAEVLYTEDFGRLGSAIWSKPPEPFGTLDSPPLSSPAIWPGAASPSSSSHYLACSMPRPILAPEFLERGLPGPLALLKQPKAFPNDLAGGLVARPEATRAINALLSGVVSLCVVLQPLRNYCFETGDYVPLGSHFDPQMIAGRVGEVLADAPAAQVQPRLPSSRMA